MGNRFRLGILDTHSIRYDSRLSCEAYTDISVAMATYNGARYLQEQLECLSGQTQKPRELVVVDDGSSDDTVTILERFKSIAPFKVRIFKNEIHLGYSATFLKAASKTSGRLVAFCDQDDKWSISKLAYAQKYFDENP